MGWIDKAKEEVMKLRKYGKSEQEIESIVHRAADAATVKENSPAAVTEKEYRERHSTTDAVDSMRYMQTMPIMIGVDMGAGDKSSSFTITVGNNSRETNNWRRLHGKPLHRIRAIRRSERNGKADRKDGHTKDI